MPEDDEMISIHGDLIRRPRYVYRVWWGRYTAGATFQDCRTEQEAVALVRDLKSKNYPEPEYERVVEGQIDLW